jgi:hypothetical protein
MKAVDQQQHFAFPAGQHGADHHGDLEAAEFGQHLQPARRCRRPAR